jgi:hypothetical protein
MRVGNKLLEALLMAFYYTLQIEKVRDVRKGDKLRRRDILLLTGGSWGGGEGRE